MPSVYVSCRQYLQHPGVSVAAGHVSLQPSHMFCQTYQCHDDQNWQAHRRQRQDLPALSARVEARKYDESMHLIIDCLFIWAMNICRMCQIYTNIDLKRQLIKSFVYCVVEDLRFDSSSDIFEIYRS